MNSREAKTTDTLTKIQSMLAKEYGLPLEKLGPEQSLVELGIDSLTTIEFMFKLEDEFFISLSEERGDLNTVRDIALLVDAVRQKNQERHKGGASISGNARYCALPPSFASIFPPSSGRETQSYYEGPGRGSRVDGVGLAVTGLCRVLCAPKW